MGSMYTATLFLGVQNAFAVQPVVGVERAVFYRERAAGMFSAFSYAFATVITLFCFQSLIYPCLTLKKQRRQNELSSKVIGMLSRL